MAYYDSPRRPVQRWDRDRFEAYGRGPPPPPAPPFERETIRIDERPGRTAVAVEDRVERGPPPPRGRFEERDRFFEEDRYAERFAPPARHRTEIILDEPTPAEIANRALAPYRRKSIVDREYVPQPPRRPTYLRRQSSLDTFDRRPVRPVYDNEWRPPAGVPIPLPIRRRSPSRRRYRETEYEEIDYRDAEPDADYRDIWIKRERSTQRKAPRSEAPKSVRSESVKSKSSSSSFEEVSKESSPVREVGKKGRTRMPKRLVHKKAVVQLGYPFEEEVSRLDQNDCCVSDVE